MKYQFNNGQDSNLNVCNKIYNQESSDENNVFIKYRTLKINLEKNKITDDKIKQILVKYNYFKDFKQTKDYYSPKKYFYRILINQKKEFLNNNSVVLSYQLDRLIKDKTMVDNYFDYLLVRDYIVTSNLGLVISIAKKMVRKNIDINDLIQEGVLGMIKCLETYDYNKGSKFSTYFYLCIKRSMKRYINESKNIIHIPENIITKSNLFSNFINDFLLKYNRYPDENSQLEFLYKLRLEENEEKSAIDACKDLIIMDMVRNVSEPVSIDSQINEDSNDTIKSTIKDAYVNVFENATQFEYKNAIFKILSLIPKSSGIVLLLRNGISLCNYYTLADIKDEFYNLTSSQLNEIYKTNKVFTLQELALILNISPEGVRIREKKVKEKMLKNKETFISYFD